MAEAMEKSQSSTQKEHFEAVEFVYKLRIPVHELKVLLYLLSVFPDKIELIAKRFGVDHTVILDNLVIARAFNSDHQVQLSCNPNWPWPMSRR
jgi:hypothetical protein